ncbi:MAG: glycosyltransferase [Prevotellaceae bacterium]|nr:glycosyltransferase [Prevotellaceae bacterium]
MQDIEWAEIPVYLYIIFGVFALCAFIQLGYYWGAFRKVAYAKQKKGNGKLQPVSIVICTKNEQQNLEKNLPLYLEQSYPEFEVVVVNDCSTDETEALLYTLKRKHKNLQVTTIEQDRKFFHDKKLAITIGIKAARHDSIIFAEPDCAPADNKWLEAMQQSFGDKGELALSYCRSARRDGLADKIMRADNVVSALFWLRGAMVGRPYRCSMKNMGLSQSLFFRSKGFARYNSYAGSEETIFLCRNGNEANTQVALAPNAILSSSQGLTFGQWFKQKCLYAALLNMGQRGVWRLRAEMFSRSIFYASLIALIALSAIDENILPLIGAAPLLLTRLITRMIIAKKWLGKLGEKGLFFWLLVYDFFSPLLAFVVAMAQPNLQKIKKIK